MKANELREKLLSGQTIQTRKLYIEGFDGLYAREMSYAQIEALREAMKKDEKTATLQWLVQCLCDESGLSVFTVDDIPTLETTLGARTAKKLLDDVLNVNGIGSDSAEEVEKNSEGGQSAASS